MSSKKHISGKYHNWQSLRPLVMMVCLFLFAGLTDASGQFAGGSGTSGDPYEISTVDQLQAIKGAPNEAYYILINDIDASATAGWNNGQGFDPVGHFGGSFDGRHFTISNLTINRPGTDQAALFTSTGASNAVFKNINFANATIKGANRAAVLVGTTAGTISNVFVTGEINGGEIIGGIAGQIDGGGSIINSSADVVVTGTGIIVGGVVGRLNSDAAADNLTVSGTVKGTTLVGGIAGQANSGSSITNSSADVDVTGTGQHVGGVVGLLNSNAAVDNLTVSGTVKGTTLVGGIAGQANSGSSIKNSSADATVTGTGNRVGGLVGWNNEGELINNSSSGSVTGTDEVGGLVGRNNGKISNSLSSSDVEGEDDVGGLVGRNQDSTIEKSYSTGNVNGKTNVGGLAGFSGYGPSLIQLSFSTSTVSASVDNAGGLVGHLQAGTIKNSYARGDVSGNNQVGGLLGLMRWGTAKVVNCFSTGLVDPISSSTQTNGGLIGQSIQSTPENSFWDTETSGFDSSAGGAGKTTDQMKQQSTFVNWNFTNIWSIDPPKNDGYPYLQAIPPVVITEIYYSRISGDWGQAGTWSVVSHSGPAATSSPGEGDTSFIGPEHTVTLDRNQVIGNGSNTVRNGGVLVTKGFVVSGTGGSFTLESGGTLHIASSAGINASRNSGNIQTTNRSFSEQANYVYYGNIVQETGSGLPSAVNNLRINNNAGVTASEHLTVTGLTVNGELHLDNGIFTMPPGSSLVANNVNKTNGNLRMQVTIDGDNTIAGNKGWRMIGSPVGTTYSDLLDGFVSQGFSGSDHPKLQPNILWFDETEIGTTNMAWRAPYNINNEVVGGRGHFFYIFDGAGMPGNNEEEKEKETYDDKLPRTMSATGLEYATGGSTFDEFGLTYTSRSEINITDTDTPTDTLKINTGWNLVGNPSTASLNWDAPSGWTKTNIDNTIYIWDPAASGGAGDFRVWNGQNGTLNSGLIAPFQAFWVRATGTNPSMQITDDVKTTGGTFVGGSGGTKKNLAADNVAAETQPGASIELRLRAGNMETTSFISFNDEGKHGEDPYDAYRLESMNNDTWLNLYTTTREHHLPMVINNLPADLDEMVTIPVYANGKHNHKSIGGPYAMDWKISENLPSYWKITLMDHERREAIPMYVSGTTGSFHVNNPAHSTTKTIPVDQQFYVPGQIISHQAEHISFTENNAQTSGLDARRRDAGLKTVKINTGPRFSIVINPEPTDEHPGYMAPEPIMLPVYPNPVRDWTTIRYSLPEQATVSIDIYDLQGRKIRRLFKAERQAGMHEVSWTPETNLSAGIYMAVMHSQNNSQSTIAHQKIVLVR